MSIKTPHKYKIEIISLVKTFNSSLEEMEKLYPHYKLNQNVMAYITNKKRFNKAKSDIQELQIQLSNNIKKLRNRINNLDDTISDLSTEHQKLTKEYKKLDNHGLAAEGELIDQKLVAAQIFIQNIFLLFLLFLPISLYKKNKF